MTHFDTVSGKYARTDKVYTRVRKFDNQIIGIALKHPATNLPPTEGQQTAQQKMKTVQAKVATIMADAAQRAAYLSSSGKTRPSARRFAVTYSPKNTPNPDL